MNLLRTKFILLNGMTRRFFMAFTTVSIISIVLVDCSKESAPDITPKILSVTPDTGSSGMMVNIAGTNFGKTTADNVVKFNGVAAEILTITQPYIGGPSATTLSVLVPQNAGTGSVTVSANGKTGTGPTFQYITPVTTDYYMKFKGNNVLYELHATDAPYVNNTTCANMFFYSTTVSGESMGLEVCWGSTITSNMILDLKGKTLPMRTNGGAPYANFYFLPNSTSWTFDSRIINNLYSTVTISDVVYHSSSQGANAYNVRGTFEGVVNDTDVSTILVTEGEFVIRLTAGKGS